MPKAKKKLTTAQKRARKKSKVERQKKYMWVLMNGKQVRVKRPPMIEGIDADEYIQQNADPIWLHQNEMWEYIQTDEELFEFKTVSVTKSGDYYQVVFLDGLDTEDEPYFMIQRQIEFPDGGICYFESHNENLVEHCKAKSVLLSTNTLRLSYGEEQRRDIEIKFGLHDTDFLELASTLKEMIPETTIEV